MNYNYYLQRMKTQGRAVRNCSSIQLHKRNFVYFSRMSRDPQKNTFDCVVAIKKNVKLVIDDYVHFKIRGINYMGQIIEVKENIISIEGNYYD